MAWEARAERREVWPRGRSLFPVAVGMTRRGDVNVYETASDPNMLMIFIGQILKVRFIFMSPH